MTAGLDMDHNVFTIGEVVEQVGQSYPEVTHSSLRFLEREGLVVPTRTPGGHRLYSSANISRILLIKQLQAKRLSLAEIRERLDFSATGSNPATLASNVLDYLLESNLDEARALIFEADEAGLPLETMFDLVLTPALVETGRRWASGELAVSHEREISQTARDIIARLSLRHSPNPRTGPTLIAAAVQGERHELGLRMVSGMLDCSGFTVFYLGADIAAEFLAEAAMRHHADAMLLSARSGERLDALHEVILAINRTFADRTPPRIIVGGTVVQSHENTLREWGAIPLLTRGTATVARDISDALA